jgi:tryptophanyl-tRNA synthetase
LAEVLNAYLAPLRARRAELLARPKLVMEALFIGTERARLVTQETLEEVHAKMGLLQTRQSAEYAAIPEPVAGVFC